MLCLQEIKARQEQVADLRLASWPHAVWNPAQRPGYSGVLILSRIEPLSVSTGIGIEEHDAEGRVATMEFEDFYLVNCYTPNSQNEPARLPYRQEWDAAFRAYVSEGLMPRVKSACIHADVTGADHCPVSVEIE